MAKANIYQCEDKVRTATNNMKGTASKVRCEFHGVGSEKCANSLEAIANRAKRAATRISRIKLIPNNMK